MSKERMTNSEWMEWVRNSIETRPSLIPSVADKEQSFLDTFFKLGVPVENLYHIMGGVVEEEKYFENMFFDVFYNRIVRAGIVDALEVPNKFTRFYRGELRKGVAWSRVMVDIMEDEAYSQTGSPIETNTDNTEGKTVEVFSDLPIKRLVVFTVPNLRGINEAFLDSDFGLDELIVQFFKRARETIEARVDDTMREVLKLSNTAGNVVSPFVDITIKKVADGYDIATGSVVDGTATLQDFGDASVETGLKLAGLINSLVSDMSERSRKYNKGNADGQHMTSLRLGSAIGIFNSNALGSMQVRDDALFGSKSTISSKFDDIIEISDLGYITSVQRTVNTKGEITSEEKTEDKNKLVIGIIAHPDFMEWKTLLDANTNFMNARTLYHNYFTHFWFATLCNPFVPAVRIILDTSEE